MLPQAQQSKQEESGAEQRALTCATSQLGHGRAQQPPQAAAAACLGPHWPGQPSQEVQGLQSNCRGWHISVTQVLTNLELKEVCMQGVAASQQLQQLHPRSLYQAPSA